VAAAEAPYHQLAALVYRIVASLHQSLKASVRHYVIDFGRSQHEGAPPAIPRLEQLLARPDFDPLRRWLDARAVKYNELQKKIDEHLNSARTAALQAESHPSES